MHVNMGGLSMSLGINVVLLGAEKCRKAAKGFLGTHLFLQNVQGSYSESAVPGVISCMVHLGVCRYLPIRVDRPREQRRRQ